MEGSAGTPSATPAQAQPHGQGPSAAPAPQGQPQEQQAGQQGQGQGAGQGRKAVPIPDRQKGERGEREKRPTLPGVVTRDSAEDFLPRDLLRDSKTGRFLSADEREEAIERELRGEDDGDHDGMPGEAAPPQPKKQAQAQAAPGEQPPKPELPADQAAQQAAEEAARKAAIKFLGEDTTLEKVEQQHRTLQGMYRAQQQQVQTVTEERDYGYRAAHAWERAFNELRAKYEGPGGSAQPAAASTAGQASTQRGQGFNVDEVLGGLDMGQFEAAVIRDGLPAAGKWLAGETLRAVVERVVPALKAEIQAQYQPLMEAHESATVDSEAEAVVQAVGSFTLPSGAQAFPETKDIRALSAIGQFWRQSGGQFQELLTREGLMRAIWAYRSAQQMAGMNTDTTPLHQPPAAGAPMQVPQPAPGPAASVPADSAPMRAGGVSAERMSPEARNLAAAFDRVQLVDPVLGFRRNPALRSGA